MKIAICVLTHEGLALGQRVGQALQREGAKPGEVDQVRLYGGKKLHASGAGGQAATSPAGSETPSAGSAAQTADSAAAAVPAGSPAAGPAASPASPAGPAPAAPVGHDPASALPLLPYPGRRMEEGLQRLFKENDALICIMATGIVVRCLAPVLAGKREDPAVIVMDEKGHFAISLLSGHIGGANALAYRLESLVGAQAVVTTATDVQGVAALDLLAQAMDAWYPDFHKNTLEVNSLLAEGKPVAIYWEDPRLRDRYAGRLNLEGLTPLTSLRGDLSAYDRVLVVTQRKDGLPAQLACPMGSRRAEEDPLQTARFIPLVPRRYVLGIGCKKGKTFAEIWREVDLFLTQEDIHPYAIKTIASIDIKKSELGILDLAQALETDFITYTAADLIPVSAKYPASDFVLQVTGVGSVAQAAADLASGGHVISERYARNGVTLALGKREEGPGGPGGEEC